MQQVAVEQVGERRGPTGQGGALRGGHEWAERAVRRALRVAQHLQHGPHQPRLVPRIDVAVAPGRGIGGQDPTAQLGREREVDVGADAVGPVRPAGAEATGQPLGEPAPHADGGHRHPFRGERVVEGRAEVVGQDADEGFDVIGDLDLEHDP